MPYNILRYLTSTAVVIDNTGTILAASGNAKDLESLDVGDNIAKHWIWKQGGLPNEINTINQEKLGHEIYDIILSGDEKMIRYIRMVLIDDKEVLIEKVIKTGGYNEWETQQGGTFNLKKGKFSLVIKSLDKNWKLNWLELTEI